MIMGRIGTDTALLIRRPHDSWFQPQYAGRSLFQSINEVSDLVSSQVADFNGVLEETSQCYRSDADLGGNVRDAEAAVFRVSGQLVLDLAVHSRLPILLL